MEFFSALSLHAPGARLVLRGELDAFAAAQLRDRLDEAVDSGCISFSVDAAAVTFLDAGGLGALVRLRNAVMPLGGDVVVTSASRRFRQIVELGQLGEAFDLDLLPEPELSEPVRRHSSGQGVACAH